MREDATGDAMRDWVTKVQSTHYIVGAVVRPGYYPRLVRYSLVMVGRETRRKCAGMGRSAFRMDASVERTGGMVNLSGRRAQLVAAAAALEDMPA